MSPDLVLAGVVATTWMVGLGVRRWRKRDALSQALRELGWTQTTPWKGALRAWLNPYRTTVEAFFEREGIGLRLEIAGGKRRACFVIESPQLRADRPLQIFETQHRLNAQDESSFSGDPAFDHDLRVVGPNHFVTALLDERLRRLLREGHVTLSRNQMQFPLTFDDTNPLSGALESHLALFRRLCLEEAELPARYLENIERDPAPGVRRTNLEALLDRPAFRATPQAHDALRIAAKDPAAEVRLAAAVRTGDAGRPIVEQLLHDPKSPSEVQEEALLHLLKTVSEERRAALLEQAFETEAPAWLRGALRALRESDRAFIEPTLALCRPGAKAEIEALAALGTLRASGPEVEARLLRYVQQFGRHPIPVGLAAIRSLALIGSPVALPVLSSVVKAEPEELLGRAAARAIASIRARLPHGAGGGLSLSEGDATSGQLSLGQGGELTKAED